MQTFDKRWQTLQMMTDEERIKLHDRNLDRFWEWAGKNPCNFHVSYPRSGLEWTSTLYEKITGEKVAFPHDVEGNYEEYLFFRHHGFRRNYVELLQSGNHKCALLIRDPRDCALSGAYRWVTLKYPSAEYKVICDEVLAKTVNEACKYWPLTYELYRPYSELIVRYEDICRNPVYELGRVLDYFGAKYEKSKIQQEVEKMDRIKTYKTDTHTTEEHLEPQQFLDGQERYEKYCGKWKRDPLFTEDYNQLILQSCKHIMSEIGLEI